jgi:Domain of unknown function (DUF4351)
MTKLRADQDSPWKLVLRQYFREAMEFFFPDVAKVVDWTKPIEFLDKEFQKITPDAAVGKRFADQLVKVHQKRGKALILLIHVEIQAVPEKGFAERMFIYAVRIIEFFHQPPTSLAILCDAKLDWRPMHYGFTTPGSALQFDFTAAKLLDYQTQWAQLEQSRNPFAAVVMAHLKTQETRNQPNDRKQWKLALVRRLYELGYNRSDVLNLFKFTDWIMILPEGLKQAFWEELQIYEETCQMPYITSVEEIGYERGVKEESERSMEREQALIMRQRALILRQLNRKIGEIPKRPLKRVNALSIDQLEVLGEALLDFNAVDDLTTWLDAQR